MKLFFIAIVLLLTSCSHAINLPDPTDYERGVVAGASACAVNQDSLIKPEPCPDGYEMMLSGQSVLCVLFHTNPGFKVWCEQNPKDKQCQK